MALAYDFEWGRDADEREAQSAFLAAVFARGAFAG